MSEKPFVKTIEDVPTIEVENSKGATIQILLGPAENMPNFHTRQFTLEPGAKIPEHKHDTIEHEQVILEGSMTLGLDGDEIVVTPGQCVYIPANCAHWYENRGTVPVRFLCMIPCTMEYQTEWI